MSHTTPNPYKYDNWEWRVQDRLCRVIADELHLRCASKWGHAMRAILEQKPMMYPPTILILRMITFNISPESSVGWWSGCFEFLDLADMLTQFGGEGDV